MSARKPKPSNLRFEQFNGFIDLTLADLTRAELATWLILFRDAKPPRWESRTSVADIAERAGASRRAISAALRALEGRGLLRVVRRGGLNVGTSIHQVWPVPRDDA